MAESLPSASDADTQNGESGSIKVWWRVYKVIDPTKTLFKFHVQLNKTDIRVMNTNSVDYLSCFILLQTNTADMLKLLCEKQH